MPIEFRCQECGKLLRTADETAGKQAKCPSCGSVQRIPAATPAAGAHGAASEPPTANPFHGVPAFDRPDLDSANPYQSPAASLAPDRDRVLAPVSPLRPTQIEIGTVLRCTWDIYKVQLGMLIAVVLVCFVLNFVAQQAGQLILVLVQAVGDVGLLIAANIVIVVLVQLVQIWLTLGQAMFMLRIGRGEDAPFTLVFQGGPYLLRAFLATILYMLLFAGVAALFGIPALIAYAITGEQDTALVVLVVGLLVGVIPLFYLGLTFSQFQFVIIDRNVGVLESFSTSSTIMSGNRLSLFALGLVTIVLNFAGALACCVGLIFTVPYCVFALAIAYLSMTGQVTADQWLHATPPAQAYSAPT